MPDQPPATSSNSNALHSDESTTSSDRPHSQRPPQLPIDLIVPDVADAGKLFLQPAGDAGDDDDLLLCPPHLMPLRSQTLEKLERMQSDAQQQLRETRARTAAATEAEAQPQRQQHSAVEAEEF